jgi:ferredoxin
MSFRSTFEVPDAAAPVIDRIVDPLEIALVDALSTKVFCAEDARIALEGATGESWPDSRLLPLLESAYRRGVLRLEDESFTTFAVSTFYDRLEVFVCTEPEAYGALPRETQVELDRWCFETYTASLDDGERPTGDRVLTLAETLALIDGVDRPIWLNRCDCRVLSGRCDKPVDTCVSFRSGINTLSHRGWATPITREEARAVVSRADAAGLMHTANDEGICNCCAGCCYLFRAQEARGAGRRWPRAERVAVLDPDLCIGCGLCVERCPFGVFELDGVGLSQHLELCRGCGLCAETCPTSALAMIPG